MYPTIEVRWFQPGQLPPEVVAWFGRLGPLPEEQPTRLDHYLRVPENDSLGIKLREGRLEIKQRAGQFGVIDFHTRVSGLVEQWRKWSFPLAHDEPVLPASDTVWLAVEKRRQLHHYRATADSQVEVVSADSAPAQGCELELSRIEVAGRRWWSICFEAFGNETNLADYLRLTAQHILEQAEPPRLEIRDSYSYPAWLGKLA